MNKKQIFIVLCLFMISLLAVSAVSATDNADNLNITATADNQEIIQVTNTQEDILADSAGTFTQLNDQIQASTSSIALDKNYTYTSGDSIVSDGISINKDITIDGAGYTIDGANQASIFHIGGNSHVVFKNINFVNAKGSDGAALRFTASDNVEIFDCNFINNSASGDGGAIYIGSASITSTSLVSEPSFKIIDSTFTDNTAGDDGGAIYVDNASGIMDNITCVNNRGVSIDKPDGSTSSTRGGTICLTGDNVIISHSSFTSGSAWMADGKDASKVDGGALFITGDNVHITDTVFEDCSATHDGGAIYIIGSHTLIDNCAFNNCTSTNNGGAIYVQGSDATINNSAFTNNNATLDGGSIYVEGNNAELYNAIFINNIAGDDGGAIYWEGNRGIMYNITCTNNRGISANKADGSTSSTRGGTICLTGDEVVIFESSFTSSSAWMADGKDASKVDGGALFITGNNVNITDTTFNDCNATHGGGALYIIGNNTTILGCSLNDCSALGGGSICIEGHDAHIFQSNITNSMSFEAGGVYVKGPNTVISANFVNCTAGDEQNGVQGSGGAIYVNGINTKIIESSFLNSAAYGGDGGAVYVGGFNTTIQESDFKFTSADDGKGGAIYIAGDSANVLDSTFSETHAEYGGAIYIGGYLTGSDAKVLNCNITSSTSGCDGGAIYVAGNKALISANIKDTRALGLNAGNGSGGAIYVGGDYSNITSSTFEDCSAGMDSFGGAIYIEGNDANIEKSAFHNTYAIDGDAGASGGAIYIAGFDAVVSESEFSECYAREGGVIFVKGGYAKVKHSNMNDCYAFDDGGAIYISGGIFTDISDSTFDNCSAKNNDGGAIYINGYVTTIRNSEFTGCTASSENGAGGAIYIEGNNATVTNAVFDSCASVDGGAIYIQGDNAGIYESEFIGNELTDYSDDDNFGGAIYVNGANAVISTSSFESHSAFTGGSIYINGKNTTIIDSNFKKSAADYGGAIFIQGANAKILGSEIDECSCIYDGGAIYVNGTNAFISADFTKCNAGSDDALDIAGNGGAIYVRGTDTNIKDSTFQNCIAANDGDGGAIYIEGASATVHNSEFKNTHAYDGGAIYIEGNDTKIQNVDISSSYTTHNGGAIYVHGVRTSVKDSTFEKTHTQNDGVGGAIEIVGENTTISDSNFTDSNSAAGGAIYVSGDNAAITGSTFSDISSATSGGAIYVAGDNTQISQDTFESCHSQGTEGYSGGGAIYVAGDGTSISDSKFTYSTSQKYGGAIYVAGKNTNIERSDFTSNYAADSAGAIYISKYSETVNGRTIIVEAQNTAITDCSFYSNTAVGAGGAVRVSGTNTTINRSQFNQNKVTFSRVDGDSRAIGGALYIDGINATVQYSAFTENTCYGKGGAIFWNGGHGGDSIIRCNFTRNSANIRDQAFGGAVYWSAGGASTPGGLIKDSIFDSNYAGKHGGGINWYRSYNSVMQNCTFINNEAYKDGGAFYIGDTGGKGRNLTIMDSKFINNTANYAGGAISIQMSESHVINSTFEGNKAIFGGSIIIKDAVTVNNEIIGCTFINSVAQNDTRYEVQIRGKGGAIFARDNSIKVYDSTFINCTAIDGGAIYWNGGMNYKNDNPSVLAGTKYLGLNGIVSNSKFINNTAVRGGAVYWQATNGTITDSTFTGNDAAEGGALYWEGGVEYMNVQFNYPKTFVVHGENGKVYNSTFTSNIAKNGGAVYWTGTNGIIDGSQFIENEADKGGAVYWNNITQTATYTVSKTNTVYSKTVAAGQNGLISNSKFFNNHAEGNDAQGGALYWNTSSSKIEDASFLNNTAGLGGAIYWTNGNSIDNATFRYNKADNGSAMYVDESAPRMDIIDSAFFENRAKANRFDPLIFDVDEDSKTVSFVAYFRGNDNIINAIYNGGENNVYFTDVSYLGVDGVKNTGNVAVSPEKIDGIPQNPIKLYQTDYEVFQTVDVTIYGANNKEIDRVIAKTDSEGKISLFYDNLDVDKASLKLKVQHPGDDYYTYLVHVEGANLTSVFIETADIYCLDDEIINITVVAQDGSIMVAPTGTISIWIDGNLFAENVQLTNEENSRFATATVIVPRCPTGTYDVYVKYDGDDDFLPEENSSSYNVFKIDDYIIVDTVDIKVGEIEPINITVFPSNKVTGNVFVWLDSQYLGNYNLTDGKIQINQKGLLSGQHYVIAHYLGDSNFDAVWNTSVFTVTKHDPYFIVNADDIFVYQNGFIWVTLPDNATGYVYLKVNGTQYYINLTNGQRNITIPQLDVDGIYDVWGFYSGDDYWYSAENTTSFKVSKYNIALDVQTADIVYGEIEQLNVTLEFEDAAGNVTIRINDTLRVFENVPIVNGIASVNVTGLVPGSYAVDVSYPGDRKYNGNVTKGSFTVGKAHIPIIIVPQNFTFLERGTAYIYVNTNGVVNATIAGVDKNNRTLLDGSTYYDLKDLVPGIYTITAHFFGNQYYYADTNETVFEVYKLNRTVDVIVHDIVYGNFEDIRVFVNATGNVTIFVNGENQTVVLTDPGYGGQGQGSVGHYQAFNGQGIWNVFNLPAGTYPVDVFYNGDMFYNPAYGKAVFRVIPANTTLSINPEDIKVWDEEHLDVTVMDAQGNVWTDATGNITIDIEGVSYSSEIKNGVARFVIPDLSVGDKEVWAFYDGDRDHNANRSLATFNVGQRIPVVNVTGRNINVGQSETVHVEIPSNATGYVILTGNFIDNPIHITQFKDGKADVTFNGLSVGNYTVHIKYYGEEYDNYTIGEAEATFEVSSIDTPIEIAVESIFYKQTASITVNVNDDAKGIITINVVNESGVIRQIKLPVFNGAVNWLVDNLAVDNYTVYAYYSGDGKYGDNETSKLFEVKKIAPVLTIESVEFNGDGNAAVVVHITSGTTGNVDITVNGKKYSGQIDDGIVRIITDQLDYGNYTVYACYAGDRNYTDASNSTMAEFPVLKYDLTITVTGIDIIVGDVEVITVEVSGEVSRPALVDVDGQGYYVNITEGRGTLKIKGLDSGFYNITARYLGDDKYNAAEAYNSFTVSKVPSTVTATAQDITVGDKEIIEIAVPADASGIVMVTVDGRVYEVSVANGKGILVVSGLKVGNYEVDVRYLGDRKYEPSENSTLFKVSPVSTEIIVIDKGNNTVEVIVGGNATGNVTVTVDGQNFTGEVINGTVIITVENITPGVHNITVIYSGDENHTGADANGTVTVPGGENHTGADANETVPGPGGEIHIPEIVTKPDIIINVGAHDIYVGDTELINVTLSDNATGNVLIEINGLVYEPVDRIMNVVRFSVENLTAGGKTVVAYYSDDDTYLPRNVTDRFTVSKHNSTVTAEIEDIYVGENVIVNVKVIDDATGQVLIDIDGVTYYANVKDGIGSVEIPRMLSGTYPVDLTYVGDDKYLPSHNTTVFRVSKVPSFVIPIAEDIYVGELENIQLAVPADAVGNVTVVIDGEVFNFNLAEGVLAAAYIEGEKYVVAISGGNGVLVISGLPEGEYVVSARYNGDDKYLPSVNDTTFTVFKVEIPDIVRDDNATVNNVQAQANDTQNLTYVDIQDYLVPIGSEDDVHAEHFEANKNNPVAETPVSEDPVSENQVSDAPISVISHDIFVGETENVTVTVPNGATGTVTIEIDGVKYTTTEIVDGKAIFKVDGLTAGEKTVIVNYSGDAKYANNATTGKFTVYKLPSTVNSTGNDIEVGDDEIIEITVPSDADGTITVEIDGVKYTTSEIENGKAKIVVPDLPAGTYTAKVFYEGSDKYLPANTTVTFEVSEAETPVDEPEEDEYEDNVTVTEEEVISYETSDEITYNATSEEVHSSEKARAGSTVLSQHETGNPILVLLLILFAAGSSQIRRFK